MISGPFDMEAARRNYHERTLSRGHRLHKLWQRARDEADRAVEIVVEKYHPSRVVQWGSILRPDLFTEVSDIDLAVEGIDNAETWSRLERDVASEVTFPLDLVRFERIHGEHQKQILSRGFVRYERE